jgi:hypothetical protein
VAAAKETEVLDNLQLHTIWGTYHKLTQQNVIIIEVTIYEIKVHLYGHKNSCSFYTAVTFSRKKKTQDL